MEKKRDVRHTNSDGEILFGRDHTYGETLPSDDGSNAPIGSVCVIVLFVLDGFSATEYM